MFQKVAGSLGSLVTGKLANSETESGISAGSKTRAFYVSLVAIIGMFVYGDIMGADTDHLINNITNLALSYIVGVSVIDSVKSYKRSNTLTPEEEATALKERYKDK